MCKGFQQNERDRLKIKAFYLHLSFSSPAKNALPDCLTLHYLPRISESPLEINESKIRSDAPGFVTLHRVVSPETKGVIYGSRDRVKASEGVRFEIYMADVKILRGIFGKDGVEENWRIDCKSMLENDDLHVKGAEVCVAVEGRAAGSAAEVITEKVEMTVKRRRPRRKSCFQKLEEIPEQREVENELEGSTCRCSECEGEKNSDGGETAEAAEQEAETERVGWALDVGLWVMCLGVGVGYLVSRASSKRLRRRKFI
ncbi:uncharacterized protein [Nicotiana sylvestris]|uniref:Uncharacterized protein LOC104228453 n=1 Tax=Nicotiana sylvestris TaxID=4096 RepID=A0A1U7WKX3_NICSY|nr:PREDICTED: uncharacterized protein LOC104228453 [Nicotiana sylvestris]